MDSSIKTPITANQDQLIMGHLLEPIAAYWYQQKTGNTVYDDTNLYQHADHPWALADFDLRFVRKEDLLSAFSKDIRPLMLNCPPCHIQQLPDLSVAHVHEVRQQDHVVLLPQELGQRRRKAVIVDGDAVSAYFKLHGVNVIVAKLRKKLRRQLRETALPHPMAHL